MSLGQIAILLGGSFIGVFAGHAIIRSILGGGQQHSPPPQQAAQSAPCQKEAYDFGKCVDLASNDISKCQVYMDSLVNCQKRHGMIS
mmetsp:Transcript_5861/g.8696  ORF Transcript_5861/g.8696 Transcript_5861/m.8696 type:complete len:87 (+) Transcript_5861:1404-1664(+)